MSEAYLHGNGGGFVLLADFTLAGNANSMGVTLPDIVSNYSEIAIKIYAKTLSEYPTYIYIGSFNIESIPASQSAFSTAFIFLFPAFPTSGVTTTRLVYNSTKISPAFRSDSWGFAKVQILAGGSQLLAAGSYIEVYGRN